MSTFTDFLKEQAEKLSTQSATRQAAIQEWHAAVSRLLDQMEAWLREADPDKVLEVERSPWEVREEGLGKYDIPRLDVRLGSRRAMVIPKARNALAHLTLPGDKEPRRAQGRVDITDEVARFILYRIPDETGERWVIRDSRDAVRPFDREAFEGVLMGLLQ